jgi:hypothetical protein
MIAIETLVTWCQVGLHFATQLIPAPTIVASESYDREDWESATVITLVICL